MAIKKIFSLWLPLLLLITGLYLVPLKIFGPDFSKIPGDLGDARFNNYILEHDYLYLTGKINNYWDAPFMYPFKNVIAFSDNLLGTAPFYALFRAMGNDRETAFQIWLLTLFILNFICCYYVLNKWSKSPVLSATGAYMFSFSILLVGNIYNVQTYPRFIIPFVFLWTWEYLNKRTITYFIYLVLGIVFQFYCGIYLGFLLVYALFFLLLSYFLIYRNFSIISQFKKKKIIGNHLIVLFVAGILMYLLMYPYITIANETHTVPSFEEVMPTIPTLRSYFFTSKAVVLWTSLSTHGKAVFDNWWCHFLFIGILPWLGIIAVPIVFLQKKTEQEMKKFILFLSLALFACFVFCLNVNGFTLYKYIYEIPGFSAMRSMNRIINVEILFFILIFVFVFKEISIQNKTLKNIFLCFPLLVVADNAINSEGIMRYNKKESQHQIELVKADIQAQYDKKYKAIAYMRNDAENIDLIAMHINVMLACQELNIKTVNCYTGHNPTEYNNFFYDLNKESLRKWCDFNRTNPEKIQIIYPYLK